MAPGDYEEIIRVIEIKDGGKPVKKLCLIRIFRDASDTPRPIIELDREDQKFFTYEIVKKFNSMKEARDYAEDHDIVDIEY